MTDKNIFEVPRIYAFILYGAGFILFLEWLYPIRVIGVTDNVFLFVTFAVFTFLLTFLQLKWWLSFLLKGFGLLFLLNSLYLKPSMLQVEWVEQFYREIVWNTNAILSQQWYDVTPFFHSMLFLLLIWLMSYLLYYWFVQMRRILLFIVLTFIYITVLDTFTAYEATYAIIRIFIISIVALALANFTREIEKESILYQVWKKSPQWIGVLMLIVLFSVVVGVFSPKYEAQWPDPVPFIQNASDNMGQLGSETVQKVGYGEDDSRLGGSFVQDNTPVFEAEVTEEHYWRIETKDYYTGKGWETAENPVYVQQQGSDIRLETFYSSVETERLIATLRFNAEEKLEKLIYPYGLEQVRTGIDSVNYFLDRSTEAVEVFENDEVIALDAYNLTYENPTFSIDALENSRETTRAELQEYLQLPDALPERVGELASEIAEPYDSRYEKTKAIEQYFNRNDFTYETTGVAVPGEDDDYVDQFLFETRAGYCDNFSTSMVVMLRTLDIPARWAKGFTSGEIIDRESAADSFVYEVTNENAHSWVEVYFPEAGWVPFEPTQGFTNPADFYSEEDDVSPAFQEEAVEEQEMEMPETESELTDEGTETAIVDEDAEKSDRDESVLLYVVVIGILLLLAYILYRFRFKLQRNWYTLKLEKKRDEKSFQDAYLYVLRLLEDKGYERRQNQTLREFANDIDERYQTNAMSELTDYYERMLYRSEFDSNELPRVTELWKKIVNDIIEV